MTRHVDTTGGAHGVVFGAWLLLFLTQTVLVPKGRIAAHRLLGYAGIMLAVLMVVSGYFAAIAMTRRGCDLFLKEGYFPCFESVCFEPKPLPQNGENS
jgi:hypothetical protein